MVAESVANKKKKISLDDACRVHRKYTLSKS